MEVRVTWRSGLHGGQGYMEVRVTWRSGLDGGQGYILHEVRVTWRSGLHSVKNTQYGDINLVMVVVVNTIDCCLLKATSMSDLYSAILKNLLFRSLVISPHILQSFSNACWLFEVEQVTRPAGNYHSTPTKVIYT